MSSESDAAQSGLTAQPRRTTIEIQIKQQEFVCSCGGCVETGSGAERAVVGGRYSLDLIEPMDSSTRIQHPWPWYRFDARTRGKSPVR